MASFPRSRSISLQESFDPFSKEGQEALQNAYENGKHYVVRALLEKGVNVVREKVAMTFRPDNYSLSSSETDASAPSSTQGNGVKGYYGCENWLQLVIPKIEVKGAMGSLLHQAAFYGCTPVVKTLITDDKVKFSVNESDSRGFKPIHYAVLQGHNEVVEVLLKNDADPNSEGDNKIRPLHIAAFNNNLDMVTLLLLFDANPNKKVYVPPPTEYKSKVWSPIIEYNSKKYSSLLHWAVAEGNVQHVEKMLNRGAVITSTTNEGITPIGLALREGREDIVLHLMKRGAELSSGDKNWKLISNEEMGLKIFRTLEKTNVDKFDSRSSNGFSLLHFAASRGCPNMLKQLLEKGIGKKELEINLTDCRGFTAIYYAIKTERYDIVDLFFRFCCFQKLHLRATRQENLLSYLTKRNLLGHYNNAIMRLLELEKIIHGPSTQDAEECLRSQLGTSEEAFKARNQLLALYKLTKWQLYSYTIWIMIVYFFLPSSLYCFDIYTDSVLAVEYYNDYLDITRPRNTSASNEPRTSELYFANMTEFEGKVNFMLTLFFILAPITLQSCWNVYVHIAREDILPLFREMSETNRKILRNSLYFLLFISPLGPIFSFGENCFVQIKCLEMSSADSEQARKKLLSESVRNTPAQDENENFFRLKRAAEGRVAIINVLEATLESASQLLLQLYILWTQYGEFKEISLGDVPIRSILSITPTDDPDSRLSKQILCVLVSLVSLTWSFTAYHRFTKSGGLSIFSSIPLLLAIFFQVFSRATACTVFILAHTWKIFIVLGIHYLIVFALKVSFERPTKACPNFVLSFVPLLTRVRPYFYVILGAFSSIFVYFRIQRPLDNDNDRHSSFHIQTLFLCLVFVENVILFAVGVSGLDDNYDYKFKMSAGVIGLASFIVGVVFQLIYYSCFGHPWVNINGPRLEKRPFRVSFFKEGQRVYYVCSRRKITREFHQDVVKKGAFLESPSTSAS